MEVTEICGALWRIMAEQSGAVSFSDLGELSGFSRAQVLLGVAKLRHNNLLLSDSLGALPTDNSSNDSLSPAPPSSSPSSSFRLKLSLNSLEWAQAIEIGVDFDALEAFATLLQASMDDVVLVAESGALASERERQLQAKINSRQQILQGKINSRLAETELAGLLGDINYLVGHPESFTHGPADTPEDLLAMQNSLLLMKQEAEGALDCLRHSLLATVR